MTPEELDSADRARAHMSEAWLRLQWASDELESARLFHTQAQVDAVRLDLAAVRRRLTEGLENV